jgi:hypothetical protein
MMDLTERIVEYIIHIYKQKNHQITKRRQKYDAVGYYIMVGYLRQEGILVQDGFEGNLKVWKLTPRGLRVADLLVKLKKEMDDVFEGTKESGVKG